MRVLIIGGGGREHALAWRIAQSPTLSALAATHANPGWPDLTTVIPADSVDAMVNVATQWKADLVVVGPEAPLAAGLVDALDIPCFGPTRAAAELEASKSFAKDVMAEAGVTTATALVVDVQDSEGLAAARARCDQGNVVVKVDGLAAGKGVFVCDTPDQAHTALNEVLGARFGSAAGRLVLEDKHTGPEVSVFALCDGTRAVPLLSAQDHKRLMDNDEGENTGGMGAIAPCPLVPDAAELVARVHQPIVDRMRERGTPFRGVLYAGLMMTAEGPIVLEFNVRFGDPECQTLMALWEDDPLPWLMGAATGALPPGRPSFRDGSACCVVLASAGYPRSSTKGVAIPEGAGPATVFLAGTRRDEAGTLRTYGGRVLGITGTGSTLSEARDAAYGTVASWSFEGAQWRTDIGSGHL